jgi:hypothetical protein
LFKPGPVVQSDTIKQLEENLGALAGSSTTKSYNGSIKHQTPSVSHNRLPRQTRSRNSDQVAIILPVRQDHQRINDPSIVMHRCDQPVAVVVFEPFS